LAGRSLTAAMLSRPLVTVLLGMPPIAWLVLAMLWFGMGDATPVFTVFIACFPIVFAGAMQGTRTLDNQLKKVALAYHLPWHMLLTDRSEEHTSELQSRENLVCRLLLEKKNKNIQMPLT